MVPYHHFVFGVVPRRTLHFGPRPEGSEIRKTTLTPPPHLPEKPTKTEPIGPPPPPNRAHWEGVGGGLTYSCSGPGSRLLRPPASADKKQTFGFHAWKVQKLCFICRWPRRAHRGRHPRTARHGRHPQMAPKPNLSYNCSKLLKGASHRGLCRGLILGSLRGILPSRSLDNGSFRMIRGNSYRLRS